VQTGTSLLGKMIGINVNDFTRTDSLYTIPADNPYVSDNNVDDRIWALGLRNPYRWSFDRATGDMWIGDVGQGAKEEVNFRAAGSTGHVNYGWRCFEGSIPTPGVSPCTPTDYVPPVFDYDNPASGGSSVTGGVVYRGPDYPSFTGFYISADVYSGTVYLLKPNGSGGWTATQQAGLQPFIVSFGEDESGRVYAASLNNGTIYKVAASNPLPVTVTNFYVRQFPNYNSLKWTTSFEQGMARFHIEFGTDNRTFQRAGQVAASRNANGSTYNFTHTISMTAPLYYRLAMEDDNGVVKYTNTIKLLHDARSEIRIYPTTIYNSILNISLPQSAIKLQLINSEGQLCFEKNMKDVLGATSILLPSLGKGVYIVQVISNNSFYKEKIMIQ
jgi:hypothetical protein